MSEVEPRNPLNAPMVVEENDIPIHCWMQENVDLLKG